MRNINLRKFVMLFIWVIISIGFAQDVNNSKVQNSSSEKPIDEHSKNVVLSPSSKILKRNSAMSLSPSSNAGGLLSLVAPDYSGSSAQMSYFSDGSSDLYIASYSHTLGYKTEKYGNFDLTFNAGKYGGSSVDDAYFIQPNLTWKFENDNFNLYFNYNGPAITKPVQKPESPIMEN